MLAWSYTQKFHLQILCLLGNIKVLLYCHISSPVPVKCYYFDLYYILFFFFAKSATHNPCYFNQPSKTATETLMHSTFPQKCVRYSHLTPVLLRKSVQYYITSSHAIIRVVPTALHLISSFHRALLKSVTFISRLTHSVIQNVDIKIYVV